MNFFLPEKKLGTEGGILYGKKKQASRSISIDRVTEQTKPVFPSHLPTEQRIVASLADQITLFFRFNLLTEKENNGTKQQKIKNLTRDHCWVSIAMIRQNSLTNTLFLWVSVAVLVKIIARWTSKTCLLFLHSLSYLSFTSLTSHSLRVRNLE